jgi:hypothetical protein
VTVRIRAYRIELESVHISSKQWLEAWCPGGTVEARSSLRRFLAFSLCFGQSPDKARRASWRDPLRSFRSYRCVR